MILRLCTLLIGVILLSGCKEEIVPEPYHPTSAYDAYRHGLVQAGLGERKLAQLWLAKGSNILDQPLYIKIPYAESFFLDDLHPEAYSYNFKTRRGQKISASVEDIDSSNVMVFMDLFKDPIEEGEEWRHVASGDTDSGMLEFEAKTDGTYTLRLQPELLAGGKFKLNVREVPIFAFPMAGRTESAILSVFGDARDAGRRIHKGNDIFASRHTPILAATSGLVTYAGERGLGGKQVWLKDRDRNLTVYFAHLDSVYVQKGQSVETGDTLGTNGNSGNAATTNPHLHFGIYADTGAIDPYHFIVPNRRLEKSIRSNIEWAGKLVRTRNNAFFDRLNDRFKNKRNLIPIHTIMKVKAAWSRSYRVELPDGQEGYVRSGDLELADTPFRSRTNKTLVPIAKHLIASNVIDSLSINQRYQLLGRFGNNEYISYEGGQGWLLGED